jgi:hypothetical protein
LASSTSWIARPVALAAFAREMQAQRPGRVGRERHALLDQPLHRGRAVLGDEARGVLVDQTGTSVLRIAHMRFDAVVAAQHADDTALGPRGGGFAQIALGQHGHRSAAGQFERHREPGQAGTDHHHRG